MLLKGVEAQESSLSAYRPVNGLWEMAAYILVHYLCVDKFAWHLLYQGSQALEA